MEWIKKLFRLKLNKSSEYTYEKNDLDKLFDDLEETAIKKARIKKHLEALLVRKEEFSLYERLSEEEINQLTLWMNHYKAIEEKKQNLRGRLIKTNKALLRLETYEDQLPEMLKEVSGTEKKVKEYERDLFYLAEEKEHLEEDREVLLNGYRFLKYVVAGLIMLMIIGVFLLIALLQVAREDTWIYLSAGCAVYIVGLLGVFYAKMRLENKLRDNEILQKKAVKYMNKTKIHYFHSKRYLEFYFDKLGIDSAAKLELYYNRYVKNKHNQKEYNKLNRQLMGIQLDMEDVFAKKGITFHETEALKEWLLSAKKNKVLEGILAEEQKITTQLKAFEAYEETLWKEVYILKEDLAYAGEVEEKIEQYMILTKENLDKNLQYA